MTTEEAVMDEQRVQSLQRICVDLANTPNQVREKTTENRRGTNCGSEFVGTMNVQ